MANYKKEYVRRFDAPEIVSQIRPRFRDFHRLKMPEKTSDYIYPAHQHKEYEVILVDKGPYRCRLNDVILDVPENCALVIKPGDIHEDHLVAGQLHWVLHFDLPGELFRSQVNPINQMSKYPFDAGKAFFHNIENEIKQGGGFVGKLQDSLLEVFFWQLVRLLPKECLSNSFRGISKHDQFTLKLYEIFDKHYKKNIDVNLIAKALKISRRSLSLNCKEILGVSPAKAFATYRIQRAIERMSEGSESIQEISYDLGFSNQYHFSRLFKKIKGVSPKYFLK